MATEIKSNSVLDALTGGDGAFCIGAVGSPSNTTEIVIDILQSCETKKVLGQLVYLVVPQDGKRMVVVGQIIRVETKNRWHEDMTFRGIIKRRGHLPHLSEHADVRTATITVQACYAVEPEAADGAVSESILGISPSTGLTIYRMRDQVLEALLRKYAGQLLCFGHVYGTDVKMPFWLKHFGDSREGGAGEAYHIGVFGRSGSGKSGLAAYMLLGYARHEEMGIIFIDPQSQFAQGLGLPFNLFENLRRLGRDVRTYRLVKRVRFAPTQVRLFCRILSKTNFYRGVGVAASENQEYAAQELQSVVQKILKERDAALDAPPGDLLRACLEVLSRDELALQRIYPSKESRSRLKATLDRLLADEDEFQRLAEEAWQPALDLFMSLDSQGNARTSLSEIIGGVIGVEGQRPIVFLDISVEGTNFERQEELVALFLREISRSLEQHGREAFKAERSLNCLVAIDEAHKYARGRSSGDTSELGSLTQAFVEAVRTTRKYGLGYMFITQTLASLHTEIIQQLRLNAFGYGLTMGGEYARLEDMVSDRQALALYRSFVDPQASRQFPFMFTGPASPLSVTGAPLFAQIFTSHEEFLEANPWVGSAERKTAEERKVLPRKQVEL